MITINELKFSIIFCRFRTIKQSKDLYKRIAARKKVAKIANKKLWFFKFRKFLFLINVNQIEFNFNFSLYDQQTNLTIRNYIMSIIIFLFSHIASHIIYLLMSRYNSLSLFKILERLKSKIVVAKDIKSSKIFMMFFVIKFQIFFIYLILSEFFNLHIISVFNHNDFRSFFFRIHQQCSQFFQKNFQA